MPIIIMTVRRSLCGALSTDRRLRSHGSSPGIKPRAVCLQIYSYITAQAEVSFTPHPMRYPYPTCEDASLPSSLASYSTTSYSVRIVALVCRQPLSDQREARKSRPFWYTIFSLYTSRSPSRSIILVGYGYKDSSWMDILVGSRYTQLSRLR